MCDTNLNRLCSLSEEEVQERYEKKPSAPIAEDDQNNEYLDPNIQNENICSCGQIESMMIMLEVKNNFMIDLNRVLKQKRK